MDARTGHRAPVVEPLHAAEDDLEGEQEEQISPPEDSGEKAEDVAGGMSETAPESAENADPTSTSDARTELPNAAEEGGDKPATAANTVVDGQMKRLESVAGVMGGLDLLSDEVDAAKAEDQASGDNESYSREGNMKEEAENVDPNVVDSSLMTTIGGTLCIDLLQLPEGGRRNCQFSCYP